MAREAASSRYDELHKDAPYHNGTFEHWSKDRGDAYPFHARDGVTIWVSQDDLSPEDNFLNDPIEVTPESLLRWS